MDVIRMIGPEPAFWCPGCQEIHMVWVSKPNELTGARWGWNGDMKLPTFSPSILVRGPKTCHSFVTAGKIAFLNDCSHPMRNQTVDLKPWE